MNCPTSARTSRNDVILLTIRGNNFLFSGAQVTIGNIKCNNVIHTAGKQQNEVKVETGVVIIIPYFIYVVIVFMYTTWQSYY
jgi:hypothetical protein